jgi:hypothetical protein
MLNIWMIYIHTLSQTVFLSLQINFYNGRFSIEIQNPKVDSLPSKSLKLFCFVPEPWKVRICHSFQLWMIIFNKKHCVI